MAESTTLDKVYSEIKALKEDIGFIKKHMFDPDSIMTAEEAKRFDHSMDEFKKGKTTSLARVKKEIRL